MTLSFVVPGKPRGKGRGRIVKKGKFHGIKTPEDTVMYENDVRDAFLRKHEGKYLTGAIRSRIYVFMQPPKSTSKKKYLRMIGREIAPGKNPDLDNVMKVIHDALNTVAYDDDKQVIDMGAKRFYGERDCVHVHLKEADDVVMG